METKRRWRAWVALCAFAAMLGCGASPGDPLDDPLALPPGVTVTTAAPAPPRSATAAAPSTTVAPATSVATADAEARLQPGDRPVVFRPESQVPADVQRFVIETLDWVHADAGDSGPLTIHAYSDEESYVAAQLSELRLPPEEGHRRVAAGESAYTAEGGNIWLYLPNLQKRSELNQRMALIHEYEHTLQFWQAQLRLQSSASTGPFFVPRWMVEGCADYLAVRVGGRRRLLDERRARDSVVTRAKATGEPLESSETGGKASVLGGDGEAYTLGWLGCERLAQRSGEDAVAHGFWLSLAKRWDWRASFAEVFGETPAAFYAEFAEFRATL
jgi:hypothetical protein